MDISYQKVYLPLSADEGGELVSSALRSSKIVHVECPLKNYGEYFEEMAKYVGDLVPMEESLDTGDKTGDLFTDIRYDSTLPDSFRHSNTRQPLHTDGSYEASAPNVTFFYCIKRARHGGATTFIEGTELCRILYDYDSNLHHAACNTPVKFFKGNDSKERPIIGKGGMVMTWNYYRAEKTPLVEKFHRFLEDKIVGGGVTFPLMLEEGEGVFFHDEELLHGRNSFVGFRWLKKGGLRWIG